MPFIVIVIVTRKIYYDSVDASRCVSQRSV
jgi:hypothetical protein